MTCPGDASYSGGLMRATLDQVSFSYPDRDFQNVLSEENHCDDSEQTIWLNCRRSDRC
jgi:hypothetical protein